MAKDSGYSYGQWVYLMWDIELKILGTFRLLSFRIAGQLLSELRRGCLCYVYHL